MRRRRDLCYFCALIVKHDYSRNCSISPAALAGVFAALAAVTLLIGVGFALLGAWLILAFAGLEVLALSAAFLCYARQVAKNDEQQG